jgi:ABC-2 type transport system permease protein
MSGEESRGAGGGTGAAGPAAAPPAQGRDAVLRQLFLTLFLRGHSARGLQRSTAPKSVGMKLLGTLLLYGLFGMSALAFARQGVFPLAVYLHAMTFLFLGTFVAASAGEILFNKEEADILLHRPVHAGALLRAKVRVLVEVSLWLAGAMNLGGMIGGIGNPRGPLFPLAHAVATVAETLFCTASVVVLYQVCLRWCGRERLEGLMTSAQVLLAMAMILGSQLLPRLMQSSHGDAAALMDRRWIYLLPPAWFACLDEVLTGGLSGRALALAGCGLAATGMLLYAAFVRLARDYEHGLQALHDAAPAVRETLPGRRWIERLAGLPPLSWLLRDPVARSSFLLSTAYLTRDRDVKLRIFPGVAPMMIMPIIFLWQGIEPRNGIDAVPIGMAGGFAGVMPLLALSLMLYSQQWQAADMFRAAPLTGPARIASGVRTAVFVVLVLPLYVIFATIVALRHGPALLPSLLPGALLYPIFSRIPAAGGRAPPFSRTPDDARAARRGLEMMGVMLLAMAVGVTGALASRNGFLLPYLGIEGALVVGVTVMLERSNARAGWRPID